MYLSKFKILKIKTLTLSYRDEVHSWLSPILSFFSLRFGDNETLQFPLSYLYILSSSLKKKERKKSGSNRNPRKKKERKKEKLTPGDKERKPYPRRRRSRMVKSWLIRAPTVHLGLLVPMSGQVFIGWVPTESTTVRLVFIRWFSFIGGGRVVSGLVIATGLTVVGHV